MKIIARFAFFISVALGCSWAGTPKFSGIPRDLPVPGTLRQVAVGDFNGDGKPDFVLSSIDENVLTVALASASNGYTYAQYALRPTAGGVSAVDVNGDGILDLVAAGNYVQTFLGRGDGTFSSPLNLSLGSAYATSQSVADFNGDGKPDLALGVSGGVNLYWGSGDGIFIFETTLTTGDYYPVIAVADFNGDSAPDLVVASTHLTVFINSGIGVFQQHTAAAPAGDAFQLVTADFNGDRVPDVAFAFVNSTGNLNSGMQIFLGARDGSLQESTAMTVPNSASYNGLVAGDFDGDGKVDVAALFWLGPTPSSGALNAVTVFPGNGDGTFGSGVSTPAGNRPAAAVAVDLNGDGFLDLVVSNYPTLANSAYGISILHGTGKLSFVQAPQIVTESKAGTSAVAAGDFNNDGTPDVITANAATSDVSVLLNKNSALQAAINSPAGLAAQLLAVGDIDGDGNLDAVVAGGRSLTVSLLRGMGDGSFSAPVPISLGLSKPPAQIALADFNRDGHLDLVALGITGEDIYVSLGIGGGLFAPPVVLSSKYSAEYLAVGDVNGDGYPDILTYQAGGFLVEYLSNGDGTFGPYQQLQGYNGLYNISLADVNGDGVLDVVFVADPIAVSLGNGDGTFGTLIQSSGLYFSGEVLAFADFNNDGKLDIALACSFYNSVVVLDGRGDGTFRDVDSYAARFYPTGVTVLDVDGDGKPDIVFSNANGVSVLPNTTN